MTRFLRVLAATLIGVGLWVVGPNAATSCACGAVITADSSASVYAETSTISYFDGVESIDMRLTLQGSAEDAAWVMPVPRGTQVSLGSADFESLYEATKPQIRVVEDWWPRLPWLFPEGMSAPEAAAPGVHVVNVQRIGPFDVTTLTGTDPQQVNHWLVEHGYQERSDLDATFGHYLDLDFNIVAVKLSPESGELTDDLPSLRMDFATDEVIYPILLSRHATTDQSLRLYLVSDHKMRITQGQANGIMKLRFAGELHKSILYPTLSFPADDSVYVTLFTGNLSPRGIVEDYVFAPDSDNEPFQEYEEVVVKRGEITTLVLIVLAFIGFVALAYRAFRKQGQQRR